MSRTQYGKRILELPMVVSGMDQGSSSATHDSTPNNNENSEDDDWQKIDHDGKVSDYHDRLLNMNKEEVEQFIAENERMIMESNAYPPPPDLSSHQSSGPSLDPNHHHTCSSCASNGGPSYQQPQPISNGQHQNSSSWNPSFSAPTFNHDNHPLTSALPPPLPHFAQYPSFQSAPNSLYNWMMQSHLANPPPLASSDAASTMIAEQVARMASIATSGSDKTNDELMHTIMKTLLKQCTDHQATSLPLNGSMHPAHSFIPGTTCLPSSIAPPPSFLQQQQQPTMYHPLSKAHEFAMFRDLERRVIEAYKGRYCNGNTAHPPTFIPYYSCYPSIAHCNEYLDPLWTACQYDKWASREYGVAVPPLTPTQPPFNPVTPTVQQNKAISEAIIYVQARYPLGSAEVSMKPEDMPPSVSYDHFTQLLPNFNTRFGEPLASFLTVLSCSIQDEMKKDSLGQTNLMTNGRHMMHSDDPPPNWERILKGPPPDHHIDFSPEMDLKMTAVLKEAIRTLVVGSTNELDEKKEHDINDSLGGIAEVTAATMAVTTQLLSSSLLYGEGSGDNTQDKVSPETKALIDAFYEKHIVQGVPIAPAPPSNDPTFLASLALASTSLPYHPQLAEQEPSRNGELLPMTDEELNEIIMMRAAMPREEVSEELKEILSGMERAGMMPPDYCNTQDLMNKLIIYQGHYGVMPAPHISLPAGIVAMNPQSGLPMTLEDINRSMLTPPELMPLHPKLKQFRHKPCNAMSTDPKKKKRIELLELSDDEESDEAGGLHSLPVSIKREYVLGVGSFGTVYEGCVVPLERANSKDLDTESDDKKVAIKAINMSYFPTYPYLKKQLDNEVTTLRQCMGFPAIVQFEGFTESPFNTVSSSQHAFIVMELMGCNLDDYVKKQDSHRLSELHAKVIIRQIQAALNYLHCRGISHCDLKPSNILLNDKSTTLPHVKLCDFGHVRTYDQTTISEADIADQTGGLGVANNRGYRAPEHATAQGFSPELDMYALGAVSYYIMTGFIPNISAPRNPVTVVTRTTKKGKKGKKIEETIEMSRMPCPSVASMVPGCVLSLSDDRMKEEEQIFDLPEDQHLWPYTSRLSYHFCKEHMRIDPRSRIHLRDSMDHEWLSGFEMYSMLRRLECKMGLFKPSERHLTTVIDDVNYQRGMLYMASNPSFIQPFSSLSGGGDLSNGSAALLNLYAREGDYSYLYGPMIRDPPQIAPLSIDVPNRTLPLVPPQSIHPSSSPLPVPLEPSSVKKSSGKPKKKAIK